MKPKLVKSSKTIKLPKASNSVEKIFRRAMDAAKIEGWTHLVVVGHNKKGKGQYFTSAMSDNDAIGMMEKAKHGIIRGD